MSIERSGVRTWMRALRVVPEPRHFAQRHPVVGLAPVSNEIDGGGRSVGLAEEYDHLTARSIGQLDGRLEGCTRIQPGASRSLESATVGERSGAIWTTVASEELRGSPVQLVWRPPRSRKATRPGKSVFHGFLASSAWVSGSCSVTMCGALLSRVCRVPTRRRR